jgi:hypothetical protein
VVRDDARLQTVTGAGLTALRNALTGLQASGGGDGPEAGWEALFSIASSTALTVDNYSTPMVLPAPASGESAGQLLGAGFRAGAARVVVAVTSAEWHDAAGVLPDANGNGLNDYSNHLGAPSRQQAVSALVSGAIQTISVVTPSTTGDPRRQGALLAQATGAIVPVAAFAGSLAPGCAAGQCCTGVSGAGEAPDGSGNCPLVFRVASDGSGVGTSLVSGVKALLANAVYNSFVVATDIDPGTVDAFLAGTTPNLTGSGAAAACAPLPPDRATTFLGQPSISPVPAGQTLCFDVAAKTNVTVPPSSSARFFRARLQLEGAVGPTQQVDLDAPRTIVFMVPPS